MLNNTNPSPSPLIADPSILNIHVVDNHEPMVDIREQTRILFGPSPEIPDNTNYTKMRKLVYEKLIAAQNLLPQGIRFCLYEAYRSLALQKLLFETHFAKIQQLHSDWSWDQIFIETTRLIAPVTNLDRSQNVPPHSTGGAIDIYLIDLENNYLDMGIHPKDWMQDVEGAVSLTAATCISIEAQKNRKIMSQALASVGFTNYPAEFWHWSYGDRYWAYRNNLTQTLYGCVDKT